LGQQQGLFSSLGTRTTLLLRSSKNWNCLKKDTNTFLKGEVIKLTGIKTKEKHLKTLRRRSMGSKQWVA